MKTPYLLRRCFTFALLSILILGLPASAQPPETLWLSLDEPAYRLLQQISPTRWPLATGEVAAVEESGVAARHDKVHVVHVSAFERDQLAQAVHVTLHRCAGFVAHDSLADALAVLAPAAGGFTPTRPDYAIAHAERVTPMLAAVSNARIGADIQTLAAFHNRYYYSSWGTQSADWLAQYWETIAAGRSDVQVTKVYRGSDAMPSVVLTVQGSDLTEQILVLGAHLDSINSYGSGSISSRRAPGADDDASGVASLTEVLRAVVEHDLRPRRSIQFMAYSGEELGLYGSDYIATDYRTREVDVVGMLQLDMTNYKGSVEDIFIIDDYTDAQQNGFLVQLAQHYLPQLTVAHTACGYGCSDHRSWNRQGYAASFPFEARMNEDNPYIHTINDTWETVGSQALHAQKFARLALAWLVELAGDGNLWEGFGDGFEDSETDS